MKIKYRVWDIEAKQIRHIVVDMHFALHGLVSVTWMDGNLNDHVLINDEDCVGGKRRFELEQFTGLHDKNGTEIYESDIVEYESEFNSSENKKKRYEVIFIGGSFDVCNPDCCDHCAKRNASHGSLNELLLNPTEVIGNIHTKEKP